MSEATRNNFWGSGGIETSMQKKKASQKATECAFSLNAAACDTILKDLAL